ncbi:DEAD/DEAH box helicase [Pedobacter miscanthi]|uniref:Helicase ATP-binding domain-containing protein n=1 Tax=Pedobacter miscanthi TaxID=2259170 RepID=A0A366KZX1_9SPHI|nr:DEAD/DEAH box helicase [Pedobacter miscanthi]RBQ06789.1 hypothetical protein DRW42_13530 [Pedobacter miscanthi]
MDTFIECKNIYKLINNNQLAKARDSTISLLQNIKDSNGIYDELINTLIREVGLYQYIDEKTSNWSDRFAKEMFKVDTGGERQAIHIEQSDVLRRLINGENIALSAPTSFGKSFIIDAFIAQKSPKNVVIIVPTISLTDETRKRLNKKFSHSYKIITTPNITLGERNIFVFPQERAVMYVEIIEEIDLLIIDEFYKISKENDSERASKLQQALIRLDHKAKQKYFLAPNISTIKQNPFTKGMVTVRKLDFNTVVLKSHKLYKEINDDLEKKKTHLLKICQKDKNLVYAALFKEIDILRELFLEKYIIRNQRQILLFSEWLKKNYHPTWTLSDLILRGIGIHNGRLHRSITQLQVLLFDDQESGLDTIISTSSLIEGVNTSAKNVIVWSFKSGKANQNLTPLSYRNIKGRAGRMFRHFIGNVYELVEPKTREQDSIQLNIEIDGSLISGITDSNYLSGVTNDQQAKSETFIEKIDAILGTGVYKSLRLHNQLNTSNEELVYKIAVELKDNYGEYKSLKMLHAAKPEKWDYILGKLIFLNAQSIRWAEDREGKQYKDARKYIQVLSKQWTTSISNLLKELEPDEIGIEDFFTLEKKVCHSFASYLHDFNVLNRIINPLDFIDITPFITKCSNAFMPGVVLELEEYGLPRMITKKIHHVNVIHFNETMNIDTAIVNFKRVGKKLIVERCGKFIEEFDEFILDNFYENI